MKKTKEEKAEQAFASAVRHLLAAAGALRRTLAAAEDAELRSGFCAGVAVLEVEVLNLRRRLLEVGELIEKR